MNKLNELWTWLNGKKTVIGASLHFVVIVLGALSSQFGISVVNAEQLNQLDQLATVIIAGGLAHKTIKHI